ncbi:MFS transporter [Paraburkholderia unamae]|uniref:MFS transporter n=1 Tax=Paraburkholderia unamae TaxID=219649 RepID=UPI001CB0D4B3|nr:MFS transporter [Paraburkholderia unamae]CAG9251919.1 MFS transporter [Paraburkholderia unamae]
MNPSETQGRLGTVALYATVFLPFAFGHYVSFVFRSINAVLAPYLVDALQLSAAQLGLLSSAYFVSFGLAQLPVGMALDRYGPRRVQLVLLGAAAAGSLLFAAGNGFGPLFAARVLTGIGLSACFMGSIKALSYWVEPRRLPSIHGYLLAVGGLGAMSATLPVELAVQALGWRTLFVVLAGITLIPAFAIHFVTPSDPLVHRVSRWPTLGSLLEVYRDRAFLRTISLLLPAHAVAFGLQGLWMGQWLQDVGGLTTREVAALLFVGMGAIVVGSLSLGNITEWAGRRFGAKPIDVAGVGVGLFLVVQLLAVLNVVPWIPALSVAFTLIGTIAGLEYTIVAQSVPPALTGRAATCLNLLIFFGAFLVQSGFGFVVAAWAPDAAHHYPAIAYRTAFAIALALQLPGFVAWLVRVVRRRWESTEAGGRGGHAVTATPAVPPDGSEPANRAGHAPLSDSSVSSTPSATAKQEAV